jgi:glucose-1-phosphate cytidylyltransferase
VTNNCWRKKEDEAVKAVILAGGLGSRISEETESRPKPMVEIGGKPILWHVMKIYSAHGINDFIICLGYKGYVIKEYFANYFLHTSDITFDMVNNQTEVHQNSAEPWRVTLVDTGEDTMTGGRLKRVAGYLDESDFCMTYGDGVGDINISALVEFHRKHGKLATLTAVQPPGRFGALELNGDQVEEFSEKPHGDGNRINGGFFVLSPKVIDYIEDDTTHWERAPLEKIAEEGQLNAFCHQGFWQPMDTLRDKRLLEKKWEDGNALWKVW